MKTPLILMASLILFLFACSETQSSKFKDDGVSLTIPKGWQITDQENMNHQGYLLSIEKDGFDSSGLVTMTWINAEIDLNEWKTNYKEDFLNNIIYENSNLVFEDPTEDHYNNINCTSIKFNASLLGIEHDGVIYFFYEEYKTFAILVQQATEDAMVNKPGFDIIEKSFEIE
ncbi:hypothetical protein [Maribacter sp. Asnod1-A12]|uniref:hypothetical protein n=1 Tax=Maribacter sp. Asnod1-A12 TaxID=3160576 RepID=UPI00386CA2F4